MHPCKLDSSIPAANGPAIACRIINNLISMSLTVNGTAVINYSSLLTIMCEPGDLFRNFIRFFIAGVS